MSEATSLHATQFEMRFFAFHDAANCCRSTSWLFGSLPASLGLPNGKCGEIALTATARFAAPSRLAGEQPARKARIIVVASVAANKEIERRFIGESFRFNGSIRD